MAVGGAIAAFIGAATAVHGSIQSAKARKEQKRQNEVSNRISATRRARSVRTAIARGRVQRAEQQAQGFTAGVSGGTAVQGAVQGTTGSVSSAIAGSNQQFTGQQAIASSQNTISGFQSSAALSGSIGNIAGAVNPQSLSSVQNLFSTGG